MAQIFRGRVRDTTTTTGTAAKVVSGTPLTTYRTFSSVMQTGDTIWAAIVSQGANEWEIGLYQYTATNTLTAVAILDSSAGGAAVSFSAGTKDVFSIGPLQLTTFGAHAPGGRLTLSSGNPVLTANFAGASTIWYVPDQHQRIPLYDGTMFHPEDFGASGLSQGLTDSSKSPAAAAANSVYDMFVWNDAGTIRCTRGPAWTNPTTRFVGLTRIGAHLVNTSSITNGPAAQRGTYVGTISTNGSANCDWIMGGQSIGGSKATLGVWNMFNRRDVAVVVSDTTGSWTYGTAAWRQANGSANNAVAWVCGLSEEPINVEYSCLVQPVTTAAPIFGTIGIGIDSTSALTAGVTAAASTVQVASSVGYFNEIATYAGYPGVGGHQVNALEWSTGSGTTFYGQGAGQTSNMQGLRFRFSM